MSSVLQQTLRGLCFDTGWCYAVFWKLKRQARAVLTWEDAFYGPKLEDINANPSTTIMPGFGQQMEEDPIGVSVAKMSYHVYSVGEGIVGRVAFTNKHQWVFSSSDKGTVANGVSNRKANPRMLPEKYPSGWEHQFVAGIKTIAVIAVPQGVVQLGSTRMIAEDLKLVGHVKALFGTLQNVPGAFLSDLVSGVQGRVHTLYPSAVPAPQLPLRDPVLINIASPALARTPSLPENLGLATTMGVAAFNSSLGCSGVGRLPMLLPSQQILAHPHSMPLPSVLGFQGSVPHFQHSLRDVPGLESLSQPPFPSVKSLCTLAGPIDMRPPKVGTSLQPGVVKPSCIAAPTSSTDSLKSNPPPQIGIISHFSLSSSAPSIVIPVSTVSPSPQAGHPSFSANSTKSISLPQLARQRSAAESWHLDSDRRSAKSQKLDSGRSSTESKELKINRSSVETRHLDWGSAVTERGQLGSDLVGNRLAGGSPLLVSPLPFPAESLQLAVDGPSIEGGQLVDNSFSIQSGHFGGTGIATGSFQPVRERSLVESSQPGDSKLFISPNADMFGGHTMHLQRSTLSTMKQDSCASDFLSFNDEASPLPCEKSLQTFASESSHLTVQMSDLLELANQFENADSDHPKDLFSGKVDIHESISSSLQCDDCFENLHCAMPCFQTSELCVGDFGSVDSSIPSLFTSELDDFDEFFAWLTKAENNESEIFSEPDVFCASTKYNEILASHSTQDCGAKEQYAYQSRGTNAAFVQVATRQAACEPIQHTLAADQPHSSWFANEATLSSKEEANTQSEPQVDQFVNSRINPEVSFPCSRPTDGVTEVGPPASTHHDIVKRGKKRSQPGEDSRVLSKDRQQIQDRIQELRAIVPDGASCSIDTLLEKAVEYTNILQTVLQDFDKSTQSTMLQIHDGGNDTGIGSEVTSLDASWVIDSGAQGRACPILVEKLSQPGQMLVEMLCEGQGMFLRIADSLKRLGLTILKGFMEARSDKIWARFLIEGPQDVHRVQVLWSLMQLLGSNTTR